ETGAIVLARADDRASLASLTDGNADDVDLAHGPLRGTRAQPLGRRDIIGRQGTQRAAPWKMPPSLAREVRAVAGPIGTGVDQALRRRTMPSPSRAVPSSAMLAGSGTGVPGSALIKSGLVPNENTTLEMVGIEASPVLVKVNTTGP